ncbi:MAG TPA: transcriptional regulator, partial [Anaerolineae bacterium]|nr:transcriptional regulator [Anaerolineae bacterium]
MTEDEVRAIYERGKGQETDFKPESTTPAKLAQSLVALANSAGGTVLLGVGSRSARLMGLKDPEAARDKALKAALLADPPLIIPLPELVNLDGAEILVITVPPGLPHVYNLKGRYLMRDGPRDAPMTSRQVRQLMMERGEVSFESLATPGATLEDIDWEKVEKYLVPLESVPGQTAKEALYKRGCLTRKGNRYRPTNAGLLLFGREPERFFRSNEIIVVR